MFICFIGDKFNSNIFYAFIPIRLKKKFYLKCYVFIVYNMLPIKRNMMDSLRLHIYSVHIDIEGAFKITQIQTIVIYIS